MQEKGQNLIKSAHNEIVFTRKAGIKDIVEQIDPFFDNHLVVIDNEVVDILDQLKLKREDLKFLDKTEGKSQWEFIGPEKRENCDCDGCKIEYTVFSSEAYDYMSNPSLEDCVPRQILNSRSSSSESSDEESSDSSGSGRNTGTSSSGSGKSGNTGTSSESSGSTSESSEGTDILTEGWSNSRSTGSLAGSLEELNQKKVRVPRVLNLGDLKKLPDQLPEGPDTSFIPDIIK